MVKFKNYAIGTIEGTTNVYPSESRRDTVYIWRNGTVKVRKSTNTIDVWKDESNEDEKNKGLGGRDKQCIWQWATSLFADVIEAINDDRVLRVMSCWEMRWRWFSLFTRARRKASRLLPLTDFR